MQLFMLTYWSTRRWVVSFVLMIILMATTGIGGAQSSYPSRRGVHLDDWPTHLGDRARHSMTEQVIAPPLTERWKIEFTVDPTQFVTLQPPLPIIGNNTMFVVHENNDTDRALLALDPRSGAEIWRQGLRDNSAFQSVVYDEVNHRVYAANQYRLYMFDPDTGRELRSTRLNDPLYNPPCGSFGLIAIEGVLFGAICDTTTRFAEDGSFEWVFREPFNDSEFAMALPVFGEGMLFTAASSTGSVFALDPATGRQIWRTGLATRTAALLYAESLVFVATRGGGVSVDRLEPPALYALDAKTGDILWGVNTGMGGSIYTTMSFHDGVLYFGALDQVVYAVDVRTPRLLWTRELPSDILGSLIWADGVLYAVHGPPTRLNALNATTGEVLWYQDRVLLPVHMAAYNNTLYIGNYNTLEALESAPIFRGITAASTVAVPSGSEVSIPIMINATHNYSETISLRIVGALPEGVSAAFEPAIIDPAETLTTQLLLRAAPGTQLRGVRQFTIEAVTETKRFTVTSRVLVAQSQNFLPVLQR